MEYSSKLLIPTTIKVYEQIYKLEFKVVQPYLRNTTYPFEAEGYISLVIEIQAEKWAIVQNYTDVKQEQSIVDSLVEWAEDTIIQQQDNKTRILMNYKTIKYVLAIEATNELREFSNKEEMNDYLETLLERDSKAKIKILTLSGKIEPEKKDLTKLIQPIN